MKNIIITLAVLMQVSLASAKTYNCTSGKVTVDSTGEVLQIRSLILSDRTVTVTLVRANVETITNSFKIFERKGSKLGGAYATEKIYASETGFNSDYDSFGLGLQNFGRNRFSSSIGSEMSISIGRKQAYGFVENCK